MKTQIKIKRVYDPVLEEDGCRILVDRVWPRGLTKADVSFDGWAKELTPSTALRKWYGHDPEKWKEFRMLYKKELAKSKEKVTAFVDLHRARRKITLLYAAKDKDHTHALVLQETLKKAFSEKK